MPLFLYLNSGRNLMTAEKLIEEIDPALELDKKTKIRIREIQQIQEAIESMNFSTQRDRVAGILNLYPETRDSDLKLTIKYWETFQPDIYTKNSDISIKNLFKLERLTTVARIRAKIQNEYGLFLGSDEVRNKRRQKEEQVRDDVLTDNPPPPYIHVFADETGKTHETVIVGSIWFLDMRKSANFQNIFNQYKNKNSFKHEFHFSEMRNTQLDLYKGLIDLVANNREFISIRAIATQRRNTARNIEDVVKHLYQLLITRGFDFEVDSGRVTAPRNITLTVDKAEGLDPIAKAEIVRDISQNVQHLHGANNQLSKISEVDSKTNGAIQVADLISGSLNRLINLENQNGVKDEFARYVVDTLNINIEGNDSFELINIT